MLEATEAGASEEGLESKLVSFPARTVDHLLLIRALDTLLAGRCLVLSETRSIAPDRRSLDPQQGSLASPASFIFPRLAHGLVPLRRVSRRLDRFRTRASATQAVLDEDHAVDGDSRSRDLHE